MLFRSAESFGVVVADNYALFVIWTLIIVGGLSLAFSGPTIERENLPAGEYYALMLFSLAGMMLMAMATDLLVIFLALEVLSLAIYVLTGIRRDSPVATEAAFKYFLLGAFASAFFLYGIAFTYGLAGSTHIDRVAALFSSQANAPGAVHLLAIGLLMVGFAFKVSAVPFQFWAPDTYEGSPVPVAAFLATASKAAGFAGLLQVMFVAFPAQHAFWAPVFAALSIATMTIGNLVALQQRQVVRLLAY